VLDESVSVTKSAFKHKSSKELIAADINMSQLSDFMNKIIAVINQHAKLLDTVSYELGIRPLKADVGEMFHILSHSFPHEEIVKAYGSDPAHA
jgi:hypothetical protein